MIYKPTPPKVNKYPKQSPLDPNRWIVDFEEDDFGAYALIVVDNVPIWRFRDGKDITIDADYEEHDTLEDFRQWILNERL